MTEEKVFDANGKVFGRLCSEIAGELMGKGDPTKLKNEKVKTVVKIINANKVIFTRNKETTKKIYSHTGFIGGLKETTPKEMIDSGNVDLLFRRGIKGMLPKNKTRKFLLQDNLIIEK